MNAVKRQAVAELQKAVAAAEQKAGEMVNAERTKMDRMMSDIRRQAREEVASMISSQEESSEVSRNVVEALCQLFQMPDTFYMCNFSFFLSELLELWSKSFRDMQRVQHSPLLWGFLPT